MADLKDKTILIVDDDPDVVAAITMSLTDQGAKVFQAVDGAQAVDMANKEKPDLVILDMMLPKRSGFLVLERIKGFEDAPLVIMVTANEGKRHHSYAESLGVDAYLLKPVPLEALITTCVDLLEKEAAEDDAAESEPRR